MTQPDKKLTVEIDSKDGVRFMALSGRIDHTNAAGFTADLEKLAKDLGSDEALVIDFSDLAFITSAGLRALFVLKKELDEAEKKFALTRLTGDVAEIFRITGFDALIPTAKTTDEALTMIAPR
ncbi:MAG: STAS domain-containing protein [Pseudomonadota bacterium]